MARLERHRDNVIASVVVVCHIEGGCRVATIAYNYGSYVHSKVDSKPFLSTRLERMIHTRFGRIPRPTTDKPLPPGPCSKRKL